MNAYSSNLIRPAARSDARILAELINEAGEGIPNWLWTRAAVEGQTPLEVGTARAARDSGGFSYTNALITFDGLTRAGMVLCYGITEAPDANPDDLPAPIVPFVALEKLSVGTFYVNALAVFAAHRNRGLGHRLMAAAEEQAKAQGFKVMSIQVYSQNTGAVRLYKSLGYEWAAQEPVRLHPAPPYYTGDVLLLKKQI